MLPVSPIEYPDVPLCGRVRKCDITSVSPTKNLPVITSDVLMVSKKYQGSASVNGDRVEPYVPPVIPTVCVPALPYTENPVPTTMADSSKEPPASYNNIPSRGLFK